MWKDESAKSSSSSSESEGTAAFLNSLEVSSEASDEPEEDEKTSGNESEDNEFPATQEDQAESSEAEDLNGALVSAETEPKDTHNPTTQLALALLDNEVQAEETRNSS